jgi:RimJ/RimL family protein N-acetyltransferase
MFEEDPPTTYLDTNRLTLRRWRKADRIPLAQLNRDRAVMEFMPDLLSAEESDRLETGGRNSYCDLDRLPRHSVSFDGFRVMDGD